MLVTTQKRNKRTASPTYSVPSLSILGDDLVLVADPVAIPSPQGSRVVNTDSVETLDFKTGTFQLIDDESERSASVGTREDVLVHEQTPDQILILPAFTETRDLQEKDTIVVKHVVNLGEESTEMAHADVLSHFKTGDLLESAGWVGGVTVIAAEDTALGFLNTGGAETLVSPGSLVAAKSNSSGMCTVVNAGIFGESAPATAEVEESFTGFQSNLLTDDCELVIL